MRLWAILLFVAVLITGCAKTESPGEALNHAAALSERGDFKGATAIYEQALQSPGLTTVQRQALEWQKEALTRIKLDYALTRDALRRKVAGSVSDLTEQEFNRWISEGRFDSKIIDGQTNYVVTSLSNLYFRDPSLMKRRLDAKENVQDERGHLEVSRLIRAAAIAQQTPYVLPHHFVCTMTVTVASNAAPAGELIRAWLPIPRKYPFQDEFKMIDSSPVVKSLGAEESPIRAAYLEEPAAKDGPTAFEIRYSYRRDGIYFALDPEKIRPPDLQDAELKHFTSEAPHVVFTDKIRALAQQIIGSQTNAMLQARAFYDWISVNTKYSFAREYSTLTNLSDYCLVNRYGDCGQEAMLFITLCRSRGIPARWESGWDIFPGAHDIHDWTEIYLAPYGWVPVDPWAGLFATTYCPSLSPAERAELHDFYFGGLDYYRMAANSDHSQSLQPPKNGLRSDDVDFQRGELEANGANIYFDKYSYHLKVEEKP